MTTESMRWAIILAGGDGTRLRAYTRSLTGDERPKQFCPVIGGRTLLETTWRRAALAVPPARTVTVVTRKHERFYAPAFAAMGARHVVAQPENRGTAAGILYPLLRVAALAPRASVVILPSDHHVSDEARFMTQVTAAFDALGAAPDRVLLLGITPDTHESEYGWIEPAGLLPGAPVVYRVRRFWEKPEPALAELLRDRGCFWNSFVMVARVRALLDLVRSAGPHLFAAFMTAAPALGTAAEAEAIRRLYSTLPPGDFSRDILQARPASLGLVPVRGVTWSDLGSPERVTTTLRQLADRRERSAVPA